MGTNLERRIDNLETQGAERWPGRPFADWTMDQILTELRRHESGLGASESALAAIAAVGHRHGNA